MQTLLRPAEGYLRPSKGTMIFRNRAVSNESVGLRNGDIDTAIIFVQIYYTHNLVLLGHLHGGCFRHKQLSNHIHSAIGVVFVVQE